jgi:hypothetical protein
MSVPLIRPSATFSQKEKGFKLTLALWERVARSAG